jgi:hypothetical protein
MTILDCMRDVSAQQEAGGLPQVTVTSGRSSRGVGHFLEENGTLVMVVGAFAVAMLTALRTGLAADGWLALVAGREIAHHGLPAHDTLTVWTNGRDWIDQQWLSQIGLYGLWRLGGLKLALLAHAALAVGGLGAAAALARRLGGSARSATWIALPVLICYYPAAAVLRPQSLAYPLFVAAFWLLATDARSPSRRVFLTLPLLVVWANLHGSAILGAGLVALAGLVELAKRLAAKRRPGVRALGLIGLPWVCLLVSPYATQLPDYYDKVTLKGGFSSFVTEWAPTTLGPVTIPFYLLVLGGMWLIGRAGHRLEAFEKLAFLATAILGFQANRNITWFALVALAVLPVLVDELRPPAVEPRRLNRMLATAVLVGAVVAVAGVATNDNAWFLRDFPPGAAAAVSTAAGSNGRVLATSSYADWLLWTRPELAGRVAYDSRFELLTRAELRRAQRFEARVEGWKEIAARFRVLVIDRDDDSSLRASLVHLGLATVVRADGKVVVLRTIPAKTTGG